MAESIWPSDLRTARVRFGRRIGSVVALALLVALSSVGGLRSRPAAAESPPFACPPACLVILPPQPDLIVKAVASDASAGWTMDVTVANQGAAGVSRCFILAINGAASGRSLCQVNLCGGIGAFQTQHVTFPSPVGCAFSVVAVVDATNRIPEPDETNNSRFFYKLC